MSATSAPFGLRPVSHPSGVIRQDYRPNGIASGYNTALYTGTPVKLTTTGTLVATGTGADETIGVFQGVEYTYAGSFFVRPYWPANQTYTDDGLMQVYFTSDPGIIYEGQCDGSVAITAIGESINLVDASTGSTYTGLSTQRLNSTTTGTGPGTWTVYGINSNPFNAPGDAYTVVLVTIQTYSGPVA